MDDDERDFRERELAQRESHHEQQLKTVRRSATLTIVGLFVSAAALGWTVVSQERQSRDQAQDLQRQQQREQYGQIVQGLASSSVAVQVSSMRQLVVYARERDNYADAEAWDEGVENSMRTLAAFIDDKSAVPDQVGLTDYQSPQPLVVSRAMSLLRIMLEDDDLGTRYVDVSRANLHGVNMPRFEPTGFVLLTGADLRRANLSELDLESGDGATTLTSAFLTCANLRDARLGEADLTNTDLTGADLDGADLRSVTGLETEQLRGARVTATTRLPDAIDAEEQPGWYGSDRCYRLVNAMTGMRGGQGYSDSVPCPVRAPGVAAADFQPPWQGDPEDLVEACRLRGR